MPKISSLFKNRQPSAIRLAQIEFSKRKDDTQAVNTAIGNVSLPMHPAMQQRMRQLGKNFSSGAVKYTPTVGYEETRLAFKNIIASSGFETDKLEVLITSGGSAAMELVILGVCGPAGSNLRPLLLIEPAYTNYQAMAKRVGRPTVSITRNLDKDGQFSLPDFEQIEQVVQKEKPGAILIIPFDNPSGQFFNQETINKFARLAVKYDLWLISDEAYRELNYTSQEVSSIWGVTADQVPGIEGRRISLESASKVWNACGLRIGALITDNQQFHAKSLAEYTANLGAGAINQYIFGALANEAHSSLQAWYEQQRDYYQDLITNTVQGLKQQLPDLIVSEPQASIYSVLDVRNLVDEQFDAQDFVMYCAQEGKVKIDDKGADSQDMTLLVSPMAGFYSGQGKENPGLTQMRVAYIQPPSQMKLVPILFKALLEKYLTC